MRFETFGGGRGTPAGSATAVHLPDEYSLVVGPGGRLPPNQLRVSFGSLSLLFDPVSRALVALEAYTNSARWEVKGLRVPEIDVQGELRAVGRFDEHGIGAGAGEDPSYVVDPDRRVLWVRFSSAAGSQRIRALSNVVCELDVQGRLLGLWVEGVEAP